MGTIVANNIQRNIFVCILMFCAAVASAYASTGSISGTVLSAATAHPLPGASVSIVQLQRGAIADKNGHFVIANLPLGTHTLRITYTGYAPVVQEVAVRSTESTTVEVKLQERFVELDEVVVTGTLTQHKLKDTPVLTEVVTEQEVRDVGSANISDVLREETGLSIGTTIGQTENASIHGMNKNHVLVLVDGERVSGKIDGAVDLGQIPVQQIQRIEVVKGPLSSIYGSDALGGVINIITKQARDTMQIQAGVTGGSNGRQDYDLSLSTTLPDVVGEGHDLSLAVWSSWNKYFGVDYNKTDNFTEIPDYDRKTLTLKTGYKAGSSFALDVKGNYHTNEFSWLSGDADNYVKDLATNDKVDLTATAKYFFANDSYLHLTSNYSNNEHGLQEFARSGVRSLNNVSIEKLYNYRLQWTMAPYEHNILSVGTEYLSESIVADRIANGEKDYSSGVAYAESEWHAHNITFSLGGRYSHNNVYGDFFSPKVSLMASPYESFKVRMSYGRGFREPSLKELFIRFANTVGYIVEGEEGLRPEKSTGFTAGLEYTPTASVWFRVNMYDNHIDNLITYYTKSNTGEHLVLSYYNVNKASISGVDADITYAPSALFQCKVGYSYTSAIDGKGNALAFRIPHAVNARITTTIEPISTRLIVFGHVYGEQIVLDDQTNKNIYDGSEQGATTTLPSYTVFHAKVERRFFDLVDVFAGVTNITNTTNYPFGQTKPREFYAGCNISL